MSYLLRSHVRHANVLALFSLTLIAGCGGHDSQAPANTTAPAPHVAVLTLNAGHSTVAVYTIGANGALSLSGTDARPVKPTAGALDSKRTHLYVTDEQTNTVFGYTIGISGTLMPLPGVSFAPAPINGHTPSLLSPVCIDLAGTVYVPFVVSALSADYLANFAFAASGSMSEVGSAANLSLSPPVYAPSQCQVQNGVGAYVLTANAVGVHYLPLTPPPSNPIPPSGFVSTLTSSNASFMALSPGETQLFVGDSVANGIYGFVVTQNGTSTNWVPATISGTSYVVGSTPSAMAIDPAGSGKALVTLFGTNQLSYGTVSNGVFTPQGSVATGACPSSVAIDASGTYAYVINQMDGTVSVYQIAGATPIDITSSLPAIQFAKGASFSSIVVR